MVVLTADNADEMIENLEAALKKVDEAHGSVVRLRRAENDVLKQVGNARDFLVAAFTDRDALQRVFAADITRTSRIHAVIDGLTLSEQTADDPRLQQCRDACSNIDRLLKELGYGDKLRDLQLSAKLKLSRRRSSCCIRSPDQTSAAIAAVMAGAQFKESLKREHVKKILACENCEDLAKLEPSKENNLGWWMIWMVHRLQLDDPSLTVLDFSNLQMPAGDHEQEVAPKLVKALANNHHIQELVMPNANLRAEEARILAETLPSNTSLKILNIDSNVLRPDDLALVIKGVGSNRSIEELRCNNQYLGDAGRSRGPALEALLEAVQANTNIVKLGMTITEAHYSNEINKQLMKNRDKVRQDRKTFAAQCSASLRSSVFRRISVGSKSPECAAELASALSADLGSETASSLAGLDANVTTTGSPERSKVRFEVPDVEDEEAQQVEKTTSVTKTTSIASSVGTESSEVWDIHEANSMPADLDANVTITGSPERSKVRFEAPEVEDE